MIRLCGASQDQLPSQKQLLGCIAPAFCKAWRDHHGTVRDENAARRSLGGLLLLECCDVRGRLAYADNGRPYVQEAGVDFSITHTARHVFCAVEFPDDRSGTLLRVGLDAEELERVRRLRISALAERWFTARELAVFQSDPTPLTFARIWTRKEALVKWTGEGISALHSADTCLAEERLGVRFYEYRVDGTLLSLCCRAEAVPPKAVEFCLDSCPTGREFRNT